MISFFSMKFLILFSNSQVCLNESFSFCFQIDKLMSIFSISSHIVLKISSLPTYIYILNNCSKSSDFLLKNQDSLNFNNQLQNILAPIIFFNKFL